MMDPGIVIHVASAARTAVSGSSSAGITNSQHSQTVQLEVAILALFVPVLGGIAHLIFRTGRVIERIGGLEARVTRIETKADAEVRAQSRERVRVGGAGGK